MLTFVFYVSTCSETATIEELFYVRPELKVQCHFDFQIKYCIVTKSSSVHWCTPTYTLFNFLFLKIIDSYNLLLSLSSIISSLCHIPCWIVLWLSYSSIANNSFIPILLYVFIWSSTLFLGFIFTYIVKTI